jgi:D-alanyl-D-alanine carboxypeptidase
MTTEKPRGGTQEVTRRLQALLDDLVARKDVQHAIVAVERGDRSFRWIGAAGAANPDGTPMREDTPYFVASVTKLYIAAAVLKLHERNEIALDESISAYLPPSLVGGLHRMQGVDRSGSITVRHLLAHSSGLADYLEDRPKEGRSLSERLFHDGDRSFDIADAMRIVREELRPHFPPRPAEAQRQRIRYSDTNYLLLIAILETLTGQELHSAFEELLFRPLELRHTWVAGHSPLAPTRPPATLWFENRPLELPLALRSVGDLYATADDTLRFLRALVRGEVFDDPATLELMRQRWNRFGLPRDAASLRAPGWPIEYGLGLMRFRLPRLLTPLRPMPAVIGHTGSTGSWLFHCPQLDLLLSGTVDQATAGAVPYRFVPRLLRSLDRHAGGGAATNRAPEPPGS